MPLLVCGTHLVKPLPSKRMTTQQPGKSLSSSSNCFTYSYFDSAMLEGGWTTRQALQGAVVERVAERSTSACTELVSENGAVLLRHADNQEAAVMQIVRH
jgi:hypothetical protein